MIDDASTMEKVLYLYDMMKEVMGDDDVEDI